MSNIAEVLKRIRSVIDAKASVQMSMGPFKCSLPDNIQAEQIYEQIMDIASVTDGVTRQKHKCQIVTILRQITAEKSESIQHTEFTDNKLHIFMADVCLIKEESGRVKLEGFYGILQADISKEWFWARTRPTISSRLPKNDSMLSIFNRQKNEVVSQSNNAPTSLMKNYKGNASVMFDLNRSSQEISQDFLVILTSSPNSGTAGMEFQTDDTTELAKKIDSFKKRVKNTSPEEHLQESFSINMSSITLQRIVKSNESSLMRHLLQITGHIEYTLKRSSASLENQKTTEDDKKSNDERKKRWWPISPWHQSSSDTDKSMKDPKKEENCEIVAGNNGEGNKLNQLNRPQALAVDTQDGILFIVDSKNHRVVAWKLGDDKGHVIAGGQGQGEQLNQLNNPTDVLIDEATRYLFISDRDNKRVVRCSSEQPSSTPEIIISEIDCYGIAMDQKGNLYVTNVANHEVRMYSKDGFSLRRVVAGGNSKGKDLDQLDYPTYITVDNNDSIYVSDNGNNRIMKWPNGAREGIVMATTQTNSDKNTSSCGLRGIAVDQRGTLYVAEMFNHRVTQWCHESNKGVTIVEGGKKRLRTHQLLCPVGLTLDASDSLYIADSNNNCVLRFSLK
ncbi:unnamed protein product [Rotaria socialis]|uniref:Uncharacterized protein n=2 Tax=Rotaria socialis TaxID=392032 RepID=A0A820ZIV8_9BILA|nr:unnamed protein product [Rotaria socialis]